MNRSNLAMVGFVVLALSASTIGAVIAGATHAFLSSAIGLAAFVLGLHCGREYGEDKVRSSMSETLNVVEKEMREMASGNMTVYVHGARCTRELQASILVEVEGESDEVAIPISQIKNGGDVYVEGDEGVLAIPKWLADDRGLDYDEERP